MTMSSNDLIVLDTHCHVLPCTNFPFESGALGTKLQKLNFCVTTDTIVVIERQASYAKGNLITRFVLMDR